MLLLESFERCRHLCVWANAWQLDASSWDTHASNIRGKVPDAEPVATALGAYGETQADMVWFLKRNLKD